MGKTPTHQHKLAFRHKTLSASTLLGQIGFD